MCHAVARIAGDDIRPSDRLVVRLTPARSHSPEVLLPEAVALPAYCIPFIRAAARGLDRIATERVRRVRGYVLGLPRSPFYTEGMANSELRPDEHFLVSLGAVIDGRLRKVTVRLSGELHRRIATEAYESDRPLVCLGRAVKDVHRWILIEPSEVELGDDE